MLNPASPLARLLSASMQPGIVRWIGMRPERRQPVLSVPSASLQLGIGLVGDRWQGQPDGRRQVTLLAAEDLAAVAGFLSRDAVTPEELRRNILVSGINLLALKECRVRIGTAVLEVTGECHPCSRMEAILGVGGYNAVRGHGGITARVVEGGEMRVGDEVRRA